MTNLQHAAAHSKDDAVCIQSIEQGLTAVRDNINSLSLIEFDYLILTLRDIRLHPDPKLDSIMANLLMIGFDAVVSAERARDDWADPPFAEKQP